MAKMKTVGIFLVRVFLFCLFIGFALMITGCAAPVVKYVVAEVPSVEMPQRPELEVLNLKQGDSAGTVVQAHRKSIVQLQEYSSILEILLQSYGRK